MADLSQIRVSGTLYDIKDAVARQATGAPAVAATVSDMTDRNKVYVYTGSESGYTSGNWYYFNGSSWVSGGVYNSAAVETDTSLSVSGAPADAKVTGDSIKYIVSVGDTPPSQHTQLLFSESTTELDLVTTETFNNEISDLRSQITNLEAIPFEVKTAMDKMFAHALYKDYDASSDYATFHAWANTIEVTSITAVFTQGENKIFTCDNLNTLKQYLVVTATYSDSSSATVDAYTLSGDLTAGTSTITVSYQDKTDTFTVSVIEGTDVTPALSSFANGVSTAHTVDGSSIRVYSTSARATCCVYTPFTPKYGYTYLISGDVTWVKGKARFGIENAGTEQGILLAPITATTESGSYSREMVLSDSDRWTTNANFKLWCTWSTSEQGDVTFSNLRIIEYLAGE